MENKIKLEELEQPQVKIVKYLGKNIAIKPVLTCDEIRTVVTCYLEVYFKENEETGFGYDFLGDYPYNPLSAKIAMLRAILVLATNVDGAADLSNDTILNGDTENMLSDNLKMYGYITTLCDKCVNDIMSLKYEQKNLLHKVGEIVDKLSKYVTKDSYSNDDINKLTETFNELKQSKIYQEFEKTK